MESTSSFGEWLRRRRRALDLTRDELALQVGCAAATIKKIESDERRPSRQLAQRLAACLQIPPADQAAFLKAARAELAVDRLASPLSTPSSLPPSRGPRAGATVSRELHGYSLHEQLGAGGFGAIYRATQPGVGREVAIKVIRPEYADHPDFIRRFEVEAQLVARLEYPHIVPLYDYWREPGGAYLVMRYMRGGSLQTALRDGRWPLDRVTRLLEQIGAALAFAHRHGVVHRDLKPANILLDEEGQAYLADFGIAKELGASAPDAQTQPGVLIGSSEYLSPEQIRDEPVTLQSDIYTLGVVLYEMLTGKHPFADLAPAEQLVRQLSAPLPPLQARCPDLPSALDPVIQRATATAPAERYPDVLSMVLDWQRASGLASVSARTWSQGASDIQIAPALSNGAVLRDTAPVLTENSQVVTEVATAENPYKGLRAFAEADAADFFGREALTQQLLERLAEEDVEARFLAVVGPSGSGKSSVVRAGLIPALRRGALPGSERWFVVELLPGAHPLEELEAALLRVAVNPPPSLLEQLQSDERGLARAIKRALPADRDVELVLIIDQFEELFTLTEEEAVRVHMLASLRAALLDPHSRVRVVVTLRADFYDRPLLYAGFGELIQQRTQVVLPLTAEELEQAIGSPAARVGVRLAPDLVAAIIKDVGEQPGTLPLLQYALTELFERRVGRALTREAYAARGGVTGALARRADEIYAFLDQQQQEASRQLFLRLINLGEGTEDTRRRVRISELGFWTADVEKQTGEAPLSQPPIISSTTPRSLHSMQYVIDLYGHYRLLTFDRDPITREPTVEVAHEALIRSWSYLRAWMDASRDDLRVQRRLAVAAADWAAAQRDASFLVGGARLVQFESLVNLELELNLEELAYLDASIAAREVQRVQEDAARQRELDQAHALAEAHRRRSEEQARASQRLRQRAFLLTLLTVLALAAMAWAGLQQQRATNQVANAERQTRLARARQILAQIANFRDNQIDLRLLLSVEATRAAETRETRAALRGALEAATYQPIIDPVAGVRDTATRQPLAAPLLAHTGAVWIIRFSPDSKLLVSPSSDKTVRLWDVATHQQHGPPLTGHAGEVYSVAFRPDGKLFAAGYGVKDGVIGLNVVVWDLARRQQLGSPHTLTLTGHTHQLVMFAFSPDGTLLATASHDKTAILWDIATQQPLSPPLTGHTGSVTAVEFSPDGKILASASNDQTIILWDVATRKPLTPPLTGHAGPIWNLAFSPDGKLLASVSGDMTVRLWDVTTHRQLGAPMMGPHEGLSVAFSQDGKRLAAGFGKTIILWDLATREPLVAPLTGHTGPVQNLVFSPDDTTLASSSEDQTIMLWDLSLESWQARACRIANRNLTQAEWNQLIGADIPYERTCPDLPTGASAPPAALAQ